MTTAEIVGDSGSLSTFTTAGRACIKKLYFWGRGRNYRKGQSFWQGIGDI